MKAGAETHSAWMPREFSNYSCRIFVPSFSYNRQAVLSLWHFVPPLRNCTDGAVPHPPFSCCKSYSVPAISISFFIHRLCRFGYFPQRYQLRGKCQIGHHGCFSKNLPLCAWHIERIFRFRFVFLPSNSFAWRKNIPWASRKASENRENKN